MVGLALGAPVGRVETMTGVLARCILRCTVADCDQCQPGVPRDTTTETRSEIAIVSR